MSVKLSGNDEREVDDLACCGGYGLQRGNIHRDMVRKVCPVMWAPEPLPVRVPYLDAVGGGRAMSFVDTKMFLPSDWLVSLLQGDDAVDVILQDIFGTHKLQDFWEAQNLEGEQVQVASDEGEG